MFHFFAYLLGLMVQKNKTPTANNTLNPITNKWKFVSVIFLLCFLFYGNTMKNGYSMDDELVTYNHPVVQKGVSAIPQIFKERYTTNSKQSYEYRPIVLLTFAIEYQLFGQKPAISHFINILLYAILCIVLFYTLLKLFENYHWRLAALATFIFLIHPLHSEVVASLKNRDEMLALLFALFALRNAFHYVNGFKIKHIVWVFLFMLLSVFSKKSTITFAALIPLCLYYFSNAKFKHIFLTSLAIVVVVWALQFGFKSLFLSKTLEAKRNLLFFENPLFELGYTFLERIPVGFYTLLFYLKMYFWPYPLVVYYGYNTIPITDWTNIYVIISMVFFTVVTAFCLYRIKKKEISTFGWLFFVIAISMFSNIVLPAVGIVAERFMFVGSVGLSVLAAYGIFNLLKISTNKNDKFTKNKIFNLLITGLLVFNLVYVFGRNQDWKSHYSIYYADIQKVPDAAKLHSLLGTYHFNQLAELRKNKQNNTTLLKQHTDSCIYHFNRAIEIYPKYAACHNNLGTAYFNFLSDVDSAVSHFNRAIEIDTAYIEAMYNLAMAKEIELDVLKDMADMFIVPDENNIIVLESDLYNVIAPEFKKYVKFKQNLYYTSNNIISASKVDKPANAKSYYQQTFLNETKSEIIKALNSTEIEKICEKLGELIIADIRKLDYSRSRINIDSAMNEYFKPYFIKYAQQKNNPREDIELAFSSLSIYALKKKDNLLSEIQKLYNRVLEIEPKYSAAYDKLNVSYFSNNMFDSMINLNIRLLQHPQYRKDILYTQIGNGYNNFNNDTLTAKYYTLAAEEKEKLFIKNSFIYNHFLKSGNAQVCNKLNVQINQLKKDIYITYVTVGTKYNEMGWVEKSQQALIKANNYNTQR